MHTFKRYYKKQRGARVKKRVEEIIVAVVVIGIFTLMLGADHIAS